MRFATSAVIFSLLSASIPIEAVAQVRSIKAVPPSVPSIGGVALPSSFSTPLPLSLGPTLAPSLSVAVSIRAAPIAPSVISPASLSAKVVSAQALIASLPNIPTQSASAAAAQSFSLLTGESVSVRRDDGDLVVLSAPSVAEPPSLPPSAPRAAEPSPETVKNVRRMMIGTSVMKSGMETITLSVPLLALTAFGGISAVAGLVVVYGLSQAIFAAMAGGLADRFSARKVLAGSVAAQAVLVSALLAVGAAGALSMGTLIPLYLLIGGVTGVIETTRHSIPTLLLGQDEAALKRYNAKLHISYEVAGVVGALTAGALIGFAGPLWSLVIQPPAFALAAWYFWRVSHPVPAVAPPAAGGLKGRLAAYLGDIKAGAKLVLGDGRMRWVALAFVLPQIVHRVFENLMIPVFAKTILAMPQASAWLLTASNLGELLGAVLLLKFAARFKGPSAWIKYGALGLLLIWALASTTSLPFLLPLILVSSLTWAASDLSLRSEVQGTVAEKDQPRALSFLYGAFVIGSAVMSLALGALLDGLGVGPALYWICAGITALALAVFVASRRLKK